MPVDYVEFEDARAQDGLRMVVVTAAPSPWGEAAKGIFYLKQIDWKAVRLDAANDAMAAWTGERSGPVAMLDDEAPRSSWIEILLLAERLAPTPALIPTDPAARSRLMGLCHELCAEGGLGWVRRLQGVHAGLNGEPGFPPPVAAYLAEKYGYRAEDASGYQARVIELLEMFAGLLHAQRREESRFYLGDSLTALDIYSATMMALFKPLPDELCPMSELLRGGFGSLDAPTASALDPILLEHRDFVYEEYLELPMTL